MDEPHLWRWIWLGAAVAFAVGEMANPGAFFLLPFAAGAALAAVLAFLDVALGWQWLVFVVGSAVAYAGLRPIARRLDLETPMTGVGSSRWVGSVGVVLQEIPGEPAASGLVRVDREEWRAESADGSAIGEGERIRVVRVEGTRVVVEAVHEAGHQEA